MVEPREDVLNPLPPRKLLPLVGLDFLWGINIKVELLFYARDKKYSDILRLRRTFE